MSKLATFQKYAGDFGSYSFLILFVKAKASEVASYVQLFESLGIRTAQPHCTKDRGVVADSDDAQRITEFCFVGDAPWA